MRFLEINSINKNNNNNAFLGQWQINNNNRLWQVDNDEFDNNEDKVYFFSIKIRLFGHMLNHVLDHIIISLVIIALPIPDFWNINISSIYLIPQWYSIIS